MCRSAKDGSPATSGRVMRLVSCLSASFRVKSICDHSAGANGCVPARLLTCGAPAACMDGTAAPPSCCEECHVDCSGTSYQLKCDLDSGK